MVIAKSSFNPISPPRMSLTMASTLAPGSSRVYVVGYHPDADPTDESNWPEQHQWMASALELFYDPFRQGVQQI